MAEEIRIVLMGANMRRSRRGLFYLFLSFSFFFLWIGYAGASQLFKRPLTLQHLTPKDGLSSEMVYAIAVQEDKIWFGTYGGGATLYDRSKNSFKAYTTKGDPPAKVDSSSRNRPRR